MQPITSQYPWCKARTEHRRCSGAGAGVDVQVQMLRIVQVIACTIPLHMQRGTCSEQIFGASQSGHSKAIKGDFLQHLTGSVSKEKTTAT